MSSRARPSEGGDKQAVSSLTRRDWAWEFLRRNPDYRRDWSHATAKTNKSLIGPDPDGAELSPGGLAFSRWGVIFRRCTGAGRTGCAGLLGASDLSACFEDR